MPKVPKVGLSVLIPVALKEDIEDTAEREGASQADVTIRWLQLGREVERRAAGAGSAPQFVAAS